MFESGHTDEPTATPLDLSKAGLQQHAEDCPDCDHTKVCAWIDSHGYTIETLWAEDS